MAIVCGRRLCLPVARGKQRKAAYQSDAKNLSCCHTPVFKANQQKVTYKDSKIKKHQKNLMLFYRKF
jgi:hypothetical protein